MVSSWCSSILYTLKPREQTQNSFLFSPSTVSNMLQGSLFCALKTCYIFLTWLSKLVSYVELLIIQFGIAWYSYLEQCQMLGLSCMLNRELIKSSSSSLWLFIRELPKSNQTSVASFCAMSLWLWAMCSLHHGVSLPRTSSQESLSYFYKGLLQARKHVKTRNMYFIGLEAQDGRSGSWPDEWHLAFSSQGRRQKSKPYWYSGSLF